MSRTHKDHRRWKRSERKRTGIGDPPKIMLHRQRFLRRIAQLTTNEIGYSAAVFRTRLQYNAEAQETTVLMDGEVIGVLSWLTYNVADTHDLIKQHVLRFDASQETPYLNKHVGRAKAIGSICRLEGLRDEFVVCVACLVCQYRRWNDEQQAPECTR